MRPIKSMFKEVKYELGKVLILNIFLEAAIVFLVTHLILTIFSIPIGFSIFLGIAYFALRFWHESRKFNLRRIEERNPTLKEMLRTANDNQNSESLMAQGLFHDVMQRMREVSSGSFLDTDQLVRRLAAIVLIALVLVGLAFFNINISKFSNPLAGPTEKIGNFFKDLIGQEAPQEEFALDDDSLYGEARMANLGDDQLQFQINPSLNEIDFNNVQDPEELGKTIKDYPGEAEAVRDESFAGGLEDVQDRKTAAEYSQQVKNR